MAKRPFLRRAINTLAPRSLRILAGAALLILLAAIPALGQDTDRFGDPLPEGVTKRFGSMRLRGLFDTVTFSPDGKFIVTEHNDSVQFWDADSGKLMDELTLPDAPPETMSGRVARVIMFSPDGRYLAHGGQLRRLVVWDVANRELVFSKPHKGGRDAINSLAFSPDGKRIVTAEDNGSVKIRDAATGEAINELVQQGRGFYDSMIAYSPGEDYIACTIDNVAHVFDGRTGESLHQIRNHHDRPMEGIAFISETEFVTCGTSLRETEDAQRRFGEIKVWSAETGLFVREFEFGQGVIRWQAMCVTPDREALVLRSARDFWVYDTQTGALTRSIPFPKQLILRTHAMAVSPDGDTLAVAGNGAILQLFDLDTGVQLLKSIVGHRGQPNRLTVSPDGTKLASVGVDGQLLIWDEETTQLLHTLDMEAKDSTWFRDCAWSPDGKYVYAVGNRTPGGFGGRPGVVVAFDVEQGGVTFDAQTNHMAWSCAVSPDGKQIAVSANLLLELMAVQPGQPAPSPYVEILDANSGRSLKTIPIENLHSTDGIVAFTADGKRLAVMTSTDGGAIELWDIEAATLVETWPTQRFHRPVFSENGRRVIFNESRTQKIHAMDVLTGESVRTFERAGMRLTTFLGISPDGTRLATRHCPLDENGGVIRPAEIRVWDIESGEALHTIPDEVVPMRWAFSPDGESLYCASFYGVLFQFDFAAGADN